nr:unnamed protein product [Callosobruchus analis]
MSVFQSLPNLGMNIIYTGKVLLASMYKQRATHRKNLQM